VRPLSDEALAFFASPEGRAALGSLSGVPKGLSGVTKLRAAGRSADEAAWLLDQAELRGRAEKKLGAEAAQLLFTREALEQASARPVAEWRAGRLAEALGSSARVLEVGAATGGDTIALAREGLRVVACELDPIRAGLLRWNVEALDLAEQIEVVEGDATIRAWTDLDGVYADPARRRQGRRTLGLEAGSPPLSVLRAIGCPQLVVKAAPGLNPDEVPAELGLAFVSLRRELKESLLAGGQLRGVFAADPGEGRAWVLSPEGRPARDLRGPRELPARVAAPGAFMFDPDPAVTRAGLIRALGCELDAWQLDPRIAFLSGDVAHDTPFATCHQVVQQGPFRRKTLAAWVRAQGAGRVDVKQRGLRGDPGQVAGKLPTKKGGPVVTAFLYQTDAGPQAVLCREVA
jgi:SAM-dependent methyltransferase